MLDAGRETFAFGDGTVAFGDDTVLIGLRYGGCPVRRTPRTPDRRAREAEKKFIVDTFHGAEDAEQ